MKVTKEALNILVGLDLSKMDHFLFIYIETLDQILNIGQITFLHNIKITELPSEVLSENRLNEVRNKVKNKLEKDISSMRLKHTYDVKVTSERFSETSFSKISDQQQFDLLILGNKQDLRGNGALANKLVRLFPAPVLLVPETFKTPIKTVVEAITFSKYTEAIVSWSKKFKINKKGDEIRKLPVYVSKVFYYPLMPQKEIEQVTKEDIRAKEKLWHKKFPDMGKLNIATAEEKGIATTLHDFAKAQKAEIMVLGIKSDSIIKDLFIGSVANEILLRSTDLALLFIKPTKKN